MEWEGNKQNDCANGRIDGLVGPSSRRDAPVYTKIENVPSTRHRSVGMTHVNNPPVLTQFVGGGMAP